MQIHVCANTQAHTHTPNFEKSLSLKILISTLDENLFKIKEYFSMFSVI